MYEYIGDHLPYFDRFDLRIYHKTREVKATGQRRGDKEMWKRYVRGQMMDGDKRAALDLMTDDNFGSDNQRAKEYRRITGESERTFYRHRDDINLRGGGE